VIAMEKRVRLPAIQADLAAARTLHAQGIPVFLTGDFNSPSFRDWTKATVGIRPDLRYPLRWPVSAAVEAAGFTDSFRAVYPNPVQVPGLTWPTHRTIPGVDQFRGEPKDRIDFVFSQGATPIASAIVGEPGSPGTVATVAPWPSDHRLVVSTFHVRGATPPALVTVPHRLVRVGDKVPASFHAAGPVTAVAIEHLRGGTASVVASRHVTAAAGRGIGTVRFASSGWAPGAYAAALLGPGGRVRSSFRFWVAPPGAPPVVRTTQATYAPGEPIGVTVKDAPGDRWDWLGIYPRGADPLVASYLLWGYTHSAIDGTFSLRPSGIFAVPLTPGRYSVYLLRDDLYVKIAGAAFSVR
jgi:Endonuclease/Exonuclease/phosphatase family